MRFELTALRICNPLHWTALPPVQGWWSRKHSKLHFPPYEGGSLPLKIPDHFWCERRDSNPHARRREILSLLCTTNFITLASLVQPPGIEPGSKALQASAMTTSAKVALIFFGVTTGNRTQTNRITICVANRYNIVTPKKTGRGIGI